MHHNKITTWVLPVLLLLTACGPAATPPPTAEPPPTATLVPPTVTPVPTPTLSPEALQVAIFDAARADDNTAMQNYIAAGANINGQDDLGVTVLEVATVRGNTGMVTMLLDAGAEFDIVTFITAVSNSNDNIAVVQPFIDHGADVNEAPDAVPAHTPLMEAAKKGLVEVGKFLLANGADINKVDSYNDPALNVAAFNGQMEFAKMLVDMGAELNIRGFGNRTAVGHAQSRGFDDIAEYLKSVGGTE